MKELALKSVYIHMQRQDVNSNTKVSRSIWQNLNMINVKSVHHKGGGEDGAQLMMLRVAKHDQR